MQHSYLILVICENSCENYNIQLIINNIPVRKDDNNNYYNFR